LGPARFPLARSGDPMIRRAAGSDGARAAGSPHAPGAGAARGSGSSILWLLLIALAAILPHVTSLQATDFAFDDRGLVSKNPLVWESSPRAAISTSSWPEMEDTGLYRPVTGLSFWLDGKIWGRDPFGFHLTNLLLHALVALTLFSVLISLFPRMRNVALVACLLFAVHPLHSEAVFSITGRAELLAALFGLLAYAQARRFAHGEGVAATGRGTTGSGARGVLALVGSALLFGLAALSKESAIGVGLLLGFHALVSSRVERARGAALRWWIAAGVWGVVLGVILLMRARVLGSVVGLGEVARTDNPLVHIPALERIVT